MLSDDLRALAAAMYAAAIEGEGRLTRVQALDMAGPLDAAAELAATLEAQIVPQAARVTSADMTPDVIDIARLLARRGVRRGDRATPSRGGDHDSVA